MSSLQYSTMKEILAVADSIRPLDETRIQAAAKHMDNLTKPLGSLGDLETIAARLVTILGGTVKFPLKKSSVVFAADHGVAKAGVSAYPSEVTAQMVLNFLHNGAAINVLARQSGAELCIVDVGVNSDFEAHPALISRKVRRSSRNFLEEAAMTETELLQALAAGLQIADENYSRGVQLAVAGEMGIGNTTAASAIAAALTGRDSDEVTGKGTGIDSQARIHKAAVVRQALIFHELENQSTAPLEILRRVGGLEIAAMAGFCLGSVAHGQIFVCDGFIATSAVAIVCALAPNARQYLVAGHCSEEPGHRILLDSIGLSPLLRLNMRLGEGTGAAMAIPIIESALHIYAEMATFESAGVSGANS